MSTNSGILNGPLNPSSSIGVDGNLYLNTTSKILFGPKVSGVWPTSGTSIIGAPGPMGNRIISGHIPPTFYDGIAGDFYIDLLSQMFYGPRTTTGWPGGFSLKGSTILSGMGPPNPTTGRDGDLYINKEDKNFYGPKVNGSWPSLGKFYRAQAPRLMLSGNAADNDSQMTLIDYIKVTLVFVILIVVFWIICSRVWPRVSVTTV